MEILSYSVRQACPIGSTGIFRFLAVPMIHDIGVSVYVMHLPWIAAYNFRAAICAAARSSSACECISGAIFSALPREQEDDDDDEEEEETRASFRAFHPQRLCGIQHLAPREITSRERHDGGTEAPEFHHSRGCHLLKFKTPPFVKRMPRFRIESRCNFERKISRRQITPAREFASST